MRVRDLKAAELVVERDSSSGCVEVRIGGATPEGATIARLTSEEARRLAALLLFQSARLERFQATLAVPSEAA
ncbi:MAG TPA: hypothetical protein VJV75_05910 [Candidatus Polarisedimenticolia bacterium]|nr:hypothetical protein [Candidatus Polarisedimenticolia bacterium]